MTIKQRNDYRKWARELVPDITAIEWRYCWRAAIPLFMLKAKIEGLRAEPRPNELYPAKLRKRKAEPKWFREPKAPRQVRLQNPDEMHGRARALLAKLFPK